jgi:hypothetical protein
MSAQAGRQRALPRLDSPTSRALHAVLDAVRQQRSSYLRLRVVMVRLLDKPLACCWQGSTCSHSQRQAQWLRVNRLERSLHALALQCGTEACAVGC